MVIANVSLSALLNQDTAGRMDNLAVAVPRPRRDGNPVKIGLPNLSCLLPKDYLIRAPADSMLGVLML